MAAHPAALPDLVHERQERLGPAQLVVTEGELPQPVRLRLANPVLSGEEALGEGRVRDGRYAVFQARLEHAVRLGRAVEEAVLDLVGAELHAAAAELRRRLPRALRAEVGDAHRLREALQLDVRQAVEPRLRPEA